MQAMIADNTITEWESLHVVDPGALVWVVALVGDDTQWHRKIDHLCRKV